MSEPTGMFTTIDARGQECPLPVVRAKKALDELGEGSVLVIVDNKTAVENLTNLAKSKHYEISTTTKSDDEFEVTLTRTAASDTGAAPMAASVATGGVVVAVSSATMGAGSDELGATLMKSFIFALTQQDELPEKVLFYNGGVTLTCEGSPVLEDLQKLSDAGVEILSCGTCLQFNELTDALKVGGVTNMYAIVEAQAQARVVIRP